MLQQAQSQVGASGAARDPRLDAFLMTILRSVMSETDLSEYNYLTSRDYVDSMLLETSTRSGQPSAAGSYDDFDDDCFAPQYSDVPIRERIVHEQYLARARPDLYVPLD